MGKWMQGDAFRVQDEWTTPSILVKIINPYLSPNSTIWCPFDLPESPFVQILSNECAVTCSHISEGRDFFTYEPVQYDYIVSNPPFSKKLAILKRLYQLNKPFAMLFPLTMLNYQEIGEFFIGKEMQLLIVDKKVSFDGNTASFNTSYVCRGVLPEKLIFTHLPDNNSGKYFRGIGG